MTSSHPWQEKQRKDSEAAAPEKVEEPKDFCSHCRSIFWGCKNLIRDSFLMAVRALLKSFLGWAVRGFFDLTSSHPWQEKKRKDSKAAAAEKVEEPNDFCSHCHSFFFWL